MDRATVFAGFSFVIGILCGSWFVPAVRAQYQTTKTTELMRTDLGSWCDGKEVTIQVLEAGPGSSGKHYHPAHSFGWIIEGSEIQIVQGRPAATHTVGDVNHEEPMQVSETQNAAPVKKLQFRIVEKGKPATTRVQ